MAVVAVVGAEEAAEEAAGGAGGYGGGGSFGLFTINNGAGGFVVDCRFTSGGGGRGWKWGSRS